jgi:hypothetical protein
MPSSSSIPHSAQTTPDPRQALRQVWHALGQQDAALSRVFLSGSDPVLPSSFAVGTAAQASIAAAGLAAA